MYFAEYMIALFSKIKIVDSCLIFSETGSDTFRSVLMYGRQQASRKNIS